MNIINKRPDTRMLKVAWGLFFAALIGTILYLFFVIVLLAKSTNNDNHFLHLIAYSILPLLLALWSALAVLFAKYHSLKSGQVKNVQDGKEFFIQLFDNASDAIYVRRFNGNPAEENFIYVNDIACRRLGYTREELLNMSNTDIVSPEMIAKVEYLHEQLVQKKKLLFETVHVAKNGKSIPVEVNTRFFNLNGEPVIIYIARNLRDREKMQTELNRWIDVFRNVEWGIVIQDVEEDTLGIMNPSYARMHGYTVDELRGKKIEEIYPIASRCDFYNHLQKINQFGHHSFESFHLRKDGTEFPVLIDASLVKNEHGEAIYRVAYVQDTTELKAKEEKIRTNRANLKALIENTTSSIWSVNTNKEVVVLNSNFGYYFHNAFGTCLKPGMKILEFLPDELRPRWEERYQQALLGEKFTVEDYFDLRGLPKHVETAFSPIYDDQQIIGVTCFAKDISEQKAKEQILLELNSTKDKFFSIIAHDLRSPFNSILGLSNILDKEAENFSQAEVKEMAGLIYDSAERTFQLLSNLLEWAKSQSNRIVFEPKIQNLASLVNNEVNLLSDVYSRKKITVKTKIDDSFMVLADTDMLRTIIRNLLVNAIKYSFEEGAIEISAINNDRGAEIVVSDHGVGIAPESIAKLFRIDNNITTAGTANEQGSGLGLTLCKEFAEKHSGSIWIESQPNKGSSVHFTLPSTSN